mgnify:CR=1 FL=1
MQWSSWSCTSVLIWRRLKQQNSVISWSWMTVEHSQNVKLHLQYFTRWDASNIMFWLVDRDVISNKISIKMSSSGCTADKIIKQTSKKPAHPKFAKKDRLAKMPTSESISSKHRWCPSPVPEWAWKSTLESKAAKSLIIISMTNQPDNTLYWPR